MHTPIDVIRVLLEESDDEHLWWYVTALRGCDIETHDPIYDGYIKRIFTCPLRGNVSTAWGVDRYDTENFPVTHEIGEVVSILVSKHDYIHYMNHVMYGYLALCDYYDILSNDVELSTINRDYYRKCAAYCNEIYHKIGELHYDCHNYPSDFTLFEKINDFVKLLRSD